MLSDGYEECHILYSAFHAISCHAQLAILLTYSAFEDTQLLRGAGARKCSYESSIKTLNCCRTSNPKQLLIAMKEMLSFALETLHYLFVREGF